MQEKSNSYRSIFKGSALFGTVQVFNILVGMIRGKLVAMILGPEGMGVYSLFNASFNTIQQFSSLGINLSVVKEVAVAKDAGDGERLSKIISITRWLLKATAILGAIITILLSYYLSVWTFGTPDYKWSFVLLAIVVALSIVANGELSILQGLYEVKNLALASVVGALVGLFCGIPLYYFWGYQGIVPAMLALSLSSFIFYRLIYRRIRYSIKCGPVKWRENIAIIKKMLSLGLVLMVATLIGTFVNYLLNMFIGRYGSLSDVGLYQAANSITNQYAGLVFTAMSLDFFPRLSAVADDNSKVREMVNQQSEIVVLIVTPLVLLVLFFSPIIIRVLLTEEFLSLIPVVRLMAVGIFFKAIAFPLGYISFSKGDKKFFFWLEGIWGNFLIFSLNTIFYYNFGLLGIGISYIMSFVIVLVVYIYMTFKRYNFYYSRSFLKLFIPLLILLSLSYSALYIEEGWIYKSIIIILFLGCALFSFYHLNKRMRLINWLRS